MAFTNFYIDPASGGSDLNAGTTTGAVAFTYAGGTFVRATGVYTVAAGDPAADGVTVGTYASVYTTAGATASTFVAQITARDATTITVDVTTLKWGVATSVSEAANAATLKVSGSWLSELPLAAGGLATFTVPTSTKVNIKQATYSITANRTISMAGATTAPIWFSGYNTAPGDLDNDTTNGLSKPIFSFGSTFFLTTSGVHQLWTGMSITGSRNGVLWNATAGSGFVVQRCRVENTNASAACNAYNVGGNDHRLIFCWFKTPTTATTNGTVFGGARNLFYGCVFEGGGVAGLNNTSVPGLVCIECVFLNNTGSGILASTGYGVISHCTFYNSTSDAIKWTGTPAGPVEINGCLFSTIGGIGINNGSGTNSNLFSRACNDFYSCSGGNEAGLGDSPAFFGQTESSSPLTSATDMTPVSTSNAKDHGFPGIFENQSYSSYVDIGAVEPASVASGGGAVFIFGG